MTDAAGVTLFLCGDVMTGRGVDQILGHPSLPDLHEPYVRDAREYVRIAEARVGKIAVPVAPEYVWGDAIGEWTRRAPAARIANLETSITRSAVHDTGKGIHYRMPPENIACLTAAGFDVCALANNHVLDYGRAGLVETLEVLERAHIRTVGAGRNLGDAAMPAVVPLEGGGRVLAAACGHRSSGIREDWEAGPDEPGVALLPDLTPDAAAAVAARACGGKRPGDVAVVSLHWGGNWGYDVAPNQVAFAHALIDRGVDVVHGHSAHHVRPIEIYRGKLILYSAGEFIDDYEGISGHETYRGDLAVMFFVTLETTTGRLASLEMIPMQIRRLRLARASAPDARWLSATLDRISQPFGVQVVVSGEAGEEVLIADRVTLRAR